MAKTIQDIPNILKYLNIPFLIPVPDPYNMDKF